MKEEKEICFPGGNRYIGHMKDGKAHGKGSMLFFKNPPPSNTPGQVSLRPDIPHYRSDRLLFSRPAGVFK